MGDINRSVARVVGLALTGLGVGAFAGGMFATRYVEKQLSSETITMPDEKTIARELKQGLITDEDARLLKDCAGEPLANGLYGAIYANHYILSHMRVAAKQFGIPEDKATYAGVGDIIDEKTAELRKQIMAEDENSGKAPGEISAMVRMEIADPESDYPLAREIAELYTLRSDNFFMGNALRGMLLNAYAWWLVGVITLWAGSAMFALGNMLTVLGLVKPQPGAPTISR